MSAPLGESLSPPLSLSSFSLNVMKSSILAKISERSHNKQGTNDAWQNKVRYVGKRETAVWDDDDEVQTPSPPARGWIGSTRRYEAYAIKANHMAARVLHDN